MILSSKALSKTALDHTQQGHHSPISLSMQPYSSSSAAPIDEADGDAAPTAFFLGVEATMALIIATNDAVLEATSLRQGSFKALIMSMISTVLAAVLVLQL